MAGVTELEAAWRQAVEGMRFMDSPVQDMTAEQLLEVVGFLVLENERLEESLRLLEMKRFQ